jgi:signal transduction histidine kinase
MTEMLESIEQHLECIRAIAAASIPDAAAPDLRYHEASLIAAYDRAEASGKAKQPLALDLTTWLEDDGHQLESLVEGLHWRLLASFGSNLDRQTRRRLIDWELTTVSLGEDFAEGPSPSKAMRSWLEESDTSIDTYYTNWITRWPKDASVPPLQIPSRYCERIGLVSARPESPRLRMPGITWLRLRGLDRLRWLLALEAVQAVGDSDPWCASSAQIAGFLRNVGRPIGYTLSTSFAQRDHPVSPGVFRWVALGILTFSWSEAKRTGIFQLTNTGEQLLRKEEAEIREIFQNLARAQAQDDRNEALDTSPPSSELAATTMRHARLVAHEVRNALLPVRYALDKVWKAIDQTQIGGTLTKPRGQIEQGISRLYQFVEASARMSAPVTELPETFIVLEAIEEARRTLPELSSIHVTTIPGTANPRCRGHRGRFVLVLLNLMRNAIQVGGPAVTLTITVDATNSTMIEVTVDDDGPGIPDALRERLFENGTSSRADGTGHGLALARGVVEDELHGTLNHEPSPSGGARFRLGLPSAPELPG